MIAVWFVVNDNAEFVFSSLVDKYLSDIYVGVLTSLPAVIPENELFILWNYRKKIEVSEKVPNIMIFHGSALPKGRGWATIYNSIASGDPIYTLTGLQLSPEIDAGDIVIEAKVTKHETMDAKTLRQIDEELTFLMLREILVNFAGKKIKGRKQTGTPSYFSRRYPEDNQIAIDAKIDDVFLKLLACEDSAPAYIEKNGFRFMLKLEPMKPPPSPEIKIRIPTLEVAFRRVQF